jgi:hypothetical protein
LSFVCLHLNSKTVKKEVKFKWEKLTKRIFLEKELIVFRAHFSLLHNFVEFCFRGVQVNVNRWESIKCSSDRLKRKIQIEKVENDLE